MGGTRRWRSPVLATLLVVALNSTALSQSCKLEGSRVVCEDGRQGVFEGDAILWPDGTRSRARPHDSVTIGHKQSVVIGKGVFVGSGKGGSVPLDDPNAPFKNRCALVNGVSYCH